MFISFLEQISRGSIELETSLTGRGDLGKQRSFMSIFLASLGLLPNSASLMRKHLASLMDYGGMANLKDVSQATTNMLGFMP